MTYEESHQIRKLCFKHKIRFYISKDRNDNYAVRLIGAHALEEWKVNTYASAVNCINYLLKMREVPVLHLN